MQHYLMLLYHLQLYQQKELHHNAQYQRNLLQQSYHLQLLWRHLSIPELTAQLQHQTLMTLKQQFLFVLVYQQNLDHHHELHIYPTPAL